MEPRSAYTVFKQVAKEAIERDATLISTKKNNEYTVRCTHCSYLLRYRVNPENMVYIIDSQPHTCSCREPTNSIFVPYIKEAVMYMQQHMDNPTVRSIKIFIADELGLKESDVNTSQIYSAMRYIRKHTIGDDSIDFLEDLSRKFNENNNGTVKLIKNDKGELESIYIEFNYSSCLAELENRVYFLDGTHTKSGFQSCILVLACATGFETVLPLAVLWCLSENTENTQQLFVNAKHLIHNHPLIKSDAAACFESVIHEHDCFHSLCMHHLTKTLKLTAATIVNDMVNAMTITEFNQLCDELSKKSPSTWTKIADKLDHYFRLGGEPSNYLYRASSPVESINAAILNARCERYAEMVISILEWGDKQFKKFKTLVKDAVKNQMVITTRASKAIADRTVIGRERFHYSLHESFAYVIPNSLSKDKDMNNVVTWPCDNPPPHKYFGKPRGRFQESFVAKTIPKNSLWCTCQEFLSSGIPCVHQCIVYRKAELESVTAQFWKVSSYTSALSIKDHIIPSIEMLQPIHIESAAQRPQPGRPRKRRYVSITEAEKAKARKFFKGNMLATIDDELTDIEDSLYELAHVLEESDGKYEGSITSLRACFDRIQILVTELDSEERLISKRAVKRVVKAASIRDVLHNLDEFSLSIFNENKAAILSSASNTFKLQSKALLNKVLLKNELLNESAKSLLVGRKQFYKTLSESIS